MTTTRATRWAGLAICGAILTGCGDDSLKDLPPGPTAGSSGPSSGAGGGTGTGGGGGAGGIPVEAATLVSTDWTLESGKEVYFCTRLTVQEDMLVTEFHPVMPLGTHHEVLSIGDAGAEPDGTIVCPDPFEGAGQQLYGAGLGSQPLIMPDGVGFRIKKGQQLHFNLHVFNTGSSQLDGTSEIKIVTAPEGSLEHEAELHIWGKSAGLTIPPNTKDWDQTASCTIGTGLSQPTLFLVQPHMHQLGTHLIVEHTPIGGAPEKVFDKPYSFEQQVHQFVDSKLNAGDNLTITCTYTNTTAQTVEFGESTKDEMCFALLWVYPAGAAFCN